uniref:Uncharacterized protein n=1 Tax=Musa acuminata subsp. malaccensis TaxID=214687 RepID=A0A804IKM7_MUSAM
MELENPSSMTASNSGSGEASISCFGQLQPTPLPLVVVKKKRNLAGIQVVYNGMRGGTDPEAEMVARSPKAFQEVRRAVRLESPSQVSSWFFDLVSAGGKASSPIEHSAMRWRARE